MESHKLDDALDNFLKSQVIYKQLAEYRDPLEALIYTEKVNQLQTFIRACAASLSIQAEIAHKDTENIKKKIDLSFRSDLQQSSLDSD